MNSKSIIMRLLPAFFPIIIYVIAEEMFGELIGIIAGVSLGIIEFIVLRIKTKKFDLFVLLDTILLAIAGTISIALSNPLFYKLKPALIEGIFVIPLLLSSFGSGTWLISQTTRFIPNIKISDDMIKKMKSSSLHIAIIMIIHVILIIITAYIASDVIWGFTSSTALFIMFGLYFLYEKIKLNKAKNNNQEEYLPLVDSSGKIIGSALRSECHSKKDHGMHPVVHIHIFNYHNEILLQKRSEHKLVQPLKWDTAVGGHVSLHESLENAAKRELFEELGISNLEISQRFTYIWKTDIETELVFVYFAYLDTINFTPNEEVSEVKYFSSAAINKNLHSNMFTPNFIHEYKLFITPELAKKK